MFEESFGANFFALSIVENKTFCAACTFTEVVAVTFLAVSGTFHTNIRSRAGDKTIVTFIGTFNTHERVSSAAVLASILVGAGSTGEFARGASTAVGVETSRARGVAASLVQVFANTAFGTSVEVRVAVLALGVDTGGADSTDRDVTFIAVFLAVFTLKVERPFALQAGAGAIAVSAVLVAVEASSVRAEVSSSGAVSVAEVVV